MTSPALRYRGHIITELDSDGHQVAMDVHTLRSCLDDLAKHVSDISAHDATELELARVDLDRLLAKLRFPILRKGAAER